MTTKYTVYANQAEDVKKRLDRLAKKAEKYGVPFSYEMGAEHPQDVRVMTVGPDCRTATQTSTYTVAAVDFDIDAEGFIKANGWTVRAKVEHGDAGNIVSGIGSKPVNPEWYTAPACCEHCNTNRFRSVTYFCENADGAIKQVGRSCLKDYTGINPATAAMWAEVTDIFDKGMDCTADEFAGRFVTRMYEVGEVLAHAYDSIKAFGYRKSDSLNSTRNDVIDRLVKKDEASAEGKAQAEEVMDWIRSLAEIAQAEDKAREEAWAEAEANADEYGQPATVRYTPNTVGDLERNCIPFVASGYTTSTGIGRLAYLPVAYKKDMERKAKEAAREAEKAAAANTSNYVGEVGKRLTINTATATLVTSWENAYGMTFLYRFTDEAGNVYIWRASRCVEIKDAMTLKGTVKDHSEYEGIKQTILTRCSVA